MKPVLLSSPLGGTALAVEDVFKAPIARVYAAWTREEDLAQWFGLSPETTLSVEIDLRVGGRILFEFERDAHPRNAVEGTYLEIEPEARLVFSWCHVVEGNDGSIARSPESRVTVTFAAEGPHTKLRLVHEAVSDAGRDTVADGWVRTLTRLQGFLAG